MPDPVPGPGEALVRVHAVSITPDELWWPSHCQTRSGSDRLPSIPGHDVSGAVEALGPDVPVALQPGDEVYGLIDLWRDGACAELVVARAEELAVKPETLGHTRAAAVPTAALTAWQALFGHAHLERGQRVLIHGAAGGVGTFAIQLAAWAGASVVGTATADNADVLRDLGADEIIDYHAGPFEHRVQDVDVVLDTVGGETLARSYAVMREHGVVVSLVEDPAGDARRPEHVRGLTFTVRPDRDQLIEVARLIDGGTLRPVIAMVSPLSEARQAFEVGARHHARGRIVLSVLE